MPQRSDSDPTENEPRTDAVEVWKEDLAKPLKELVEDTCPTSKPPDAKL